jgi:hypothetical protein
VNAIFLPRQARDKHRESTQKRLPFYQGRPIYYSICPHAPTPALGAAKEFAGKGQLSYAPPVQWSAAQRHALANSILVEYVNPYDEWYAPRRSSACQWVNDSWRGRFSHDCHGGIVTDIDAMLQVRHEITLCCCSISLYETAQGDLPRQAMGEHLRGETQQRTKRAFRADDEAQLLDALLMERCGKRLC